MNKGAVDDGLIVLMLLGFSGAKDQRMYSGKY